MAEKPPPRSERDPNRLSPEINPSYANLPTEPEQSSQTDRFLHLGWEIAKTIGFIVLVAFVIRAWLVQPFVVDGESMEPDFHQGDYLLVDQVSYSLGEPSRGDVIVFKAPPNENENYIKRVIGLPGETVELRNGKVFIFNQANQRGMELKEPYILPGASTLQESPERRWQLRDKEYFVLGDNRLPNKSSDSRVWGPVREDKVIGKAWIRAYPLAGFGFVKQHEFSNLTLLYQVGRT